MLCMFKHNSLLRDHGYAKDKHGHTSSSQSAKYSIINITMASEQSQTQFGSRSYSERSIKLAKQID